MLPNHWKTKMHWNLSNKYDIFQKHEKNSPHAQNPCRAGLNLPKENFPCLEHKDFQHIHSKQRHFSELKIERGYN